MNRRLNQKGYDHLYHRDSQHRQGLKQHPNVRRPAFTLIELLVALSLASLLVTATGSMAVQTLICRDRAADIVNRQNAEAVIVDRLTEDLSSLLTGLPASTTSLELTGSSIPSLRLDVLSPVDDPGRSLHLAQHPATVHYRLVRQDDNREGYRFIRVHLDRTNPKKISRKEQLGEDLSAITFEVWQHDHWVSIYPPLRGQSEPVVLLRMAVKWVGSAETTSYVFEVNENQ